MLLGDDACVRMVPGLDVHHDQVAAGHGARIDTIDAGLLYYMMSRGLDHHQAQSLIVS
jgi:Fe-S cluster assembly scaffold protein SufB